MQARIAAALIAAALLGLPTAARSETIELIPVDAGQVDSTGYHDYSAYDIQATEGLGLRSFLVFDISTITDPIVAATWVVLADHSPSGSTVLVYEVSTPGATLVGNVGSFTDPAVYADLHSVPSYGAVWMNGSGGSLALNDAAVSALNAASTTFALGLTSSDQAFGDGYASLVDLRSSHKLVIETAPAQVPLLDGRAVTALACTFALAGFWLASGGARRSA